MDKVNIASNKNRRGVFRIYEEIHLFYKKIDEQQLTESYPVFDNILNKPSAFTELETVSQNIALARLGKKRPEDLQLNPNNTRNVNISASGMAFSCEDALKPGDYLAIKMTLASSITDIVTYAKVVYCQNSPVNDSQYPYFVGAHFINMEAQDQELLSQYVAKKRLRQTWVNGFILAAVLTIIAAPAAILGLLVELLHFLLELLLEFIHLGFEFIESNLDKVIEHFFETDLHKTQVIVFYIILSAIFYGLYRLWRVLPPFCLRCKRNQIAYWSRKKASLLYYWRELTLFNKIKLIVIGVAAISIYVFFGL